MGETPKNEGLDVTGLGKVASAIPKEVYERSAATLLTTFEMLTAPITESTSGLGRYLRQKFDNMVQVEKAIATYTVEKALHRASERCERARISLRAPAHPKSFVRAIEEASKETDPVLHEMWANLLASQLSDGVCHPHFVEVLPHFSPTEAKLLVSLLPESEIGEHKSYISVNPRPSLRWIRMNSESEFQPWTISCDLLFEFRFVHLASATPSSRSLAVMYLTPLGSAFLAAVTPPEPAG
jgi:hypothetical protein